MDNRKPDGEICGVQDSWRRSMIAHYSQGAEQPEEPTELEGKHEGKRKRSVRKPLIGLFCGLLTTALCLFAVICTLGYLTYSGSALKSQTIGYPGDSSLPKYVMSLYRCGIDSLYLKHYSVAWHIFVEAGRQAVCIDETDFLLDGGSDDVYLYRYIELSEDEFEIKDIPEEDFDKVCDAFEAVMENQE